MAYYSQEVAVFEAQIQSWIDCGNEGRWVVIHGIEVFDFFDSEVVAYRAAIEHFGQDAKFLLRQVRQGRPRLVAPIMTLRTESV